METVIKYQLFVDRRDDLERILELLDTSLGLLRDTSEIYKKKPEKKQDPVVKLARTVGRELKAFGGMGLGKQTHSETDKGCVHSDLRLQTHTRE